MAPSKGFLASTLGGHRIDALAADDVEKPGGRTAWALVAALELADAANP